MGGPDNKPGHDEGEYVSLIAAWYYVSAFICGSKFLLVSPPIEDRR
jgi:hypothetical protein